MSLCFNLIFISSVLLLEQEEKLNPFVKFLFFFKGETIFD